MTLQTSIDVVSEVRGLVSVTVGGQLFGVPVLQVQDVIVGRRIDAVPLAPVEIAGSLNLRGRIVTAIDMRVRLGLERRGSDERFLCVIVERANELYALLVDDVGDVLWLNAEQHENAPMTMSTQLRDLTNGLYRLDGQLLMVLSVEAVLKLS